MRVVPKSFESLPFQIFLNMWNVYFAQIILFSILVQVHTFVIVKMADDANYLCHKYKDHSSRNANANESLESSDDHADANAAEAMDVRGHGGGCTGHAAGCIAGQGGGQRSR
jgi:hypothetical protein